MSPRRLFPLLVALAMCLLSPRVYSENPDWPEQISDADDLSDPANMPDDPGYYRQRVEGEAVVEVDGAWNMWSFVPQLWIDTGDPIREEELELGTGMHADRAWLLTTGRRDVLIAVLDSGVRWHNADLVNKYYLNPGELDRDGARPCVPEAFEGDPLDVNGDGFFNIQDYTAFPDDCTTDLDALGNNNGLVDPEDLLLNATYADGVDDDGNAYVDDISGWDFFHNDNNARDDTDFGHGNGEAQDSGAEGNNGMGGIGVCPECTILMVRAGDSFVTDANDFADGVVFAIDSGADVIQEALGVINNTTFSRQAIEYAYENNSVVIASAADELSFHHNLPGTNNHTVYVHAVVHDRGRPRSTTFLNYNNCTNHGAQLLLSTPGGGCSSEATGMTSGHAGLIYSYARDLAVDPPLSAEEVRGLLIMSVDDINVPESQPGHPGNDGTKFPSAEGWDFHFGYGRNNVRASLDLIGDDAIPPELDIVSPAWFDVLDPRAAATIDVVGRVGARVDGLDPRYDEYDYELAVAAGAEPQDNDFEVVASGTTASLDGVIGSVDSADFDTAGIAVDAHDFSVTVRLRACVTGTGAFGAGNCNEFRKAFFIHQDDQSVGGFPLYMGSSGEASPVFYDLDGDGSDELIVPTADGIMHAYQPGSTELEGWPVTFDGRRGHRADQPNDHAGACAYRPADNRGECPTRGHVDYEVLHTSAVGTPAIANLEGDEDGAAQVVVTSFDGFVYAFNADGSRVDGFPVRTDEALSADTDENNVWDEGIAGAAVLYDLDGDDDLEIISGAMDQHVYVWHHDGTPADGFPVYCRDFARDDDPDLTPSLGARIFATPAVGDLDQDGDPEIITGTNEVYSTVESRYYIIHWDGNEHEGGPFEWVDPDADAPGPARNIASAGEVLPMVGRGIPGAALADFDFDGYIEFAIEGIGQQPEIRRWDGFEILELIFLNNARPAFGPDSNVTDVNSFALISHGAFGYLDDSGDLAFVKGAAGIDFALAFAAGGTAASFQHQLAAWNTRTGLPLQAFPQAMEDWQFFVTPTIVDLNDDGFPEMINGSGGYLVHAFDFRGDEPTGWPKQTGGWIVTSAAVGDFDGDDVYDVASVTRFGNLFVWETSGSTDGAIEWLGFGHDNQNTFNYETPIPGQDRQPPIGGEDDGTEVVEAVPDTAEQPPDAGLDSGGDATSGDEPSDDAVLSDEGCCSVAGRGGRTTLELLLLLPLVVLCHRRIWRAV